MTNQEIYNHQEYKRFKDKYFSDIIGLDQVILEIFKIYSMQEVNRIKRKLNLPLNRQGLNMVFSGNPGTGKTTVARKVAKMFSDIHYLSRNHIMEIDRSDLVGEYVGQTTVKTKAILEEAKGGVLFIDEAYSLYNEDYQDFGSEAIDIIMKFVEDHHDDMIVILAGYNDKIEKMLKSSRGLSGRFPIKIPFPDYSITELIQIFKSIIKINGYQCTRALENKFYRYLVKLKENHDPELIQNGRFIRNVCEQIIRNHDLKVYLNKNYGEKLTILDDVDFQT